MLGSFQKSVSVEREHGTLQAKLSAHKVYFIAFRFELSCFGFFSYCFPAVFSLLETQSVKMKMDETSDIFNSMIMQVSQFTKHHLECGFEMMITLRSRCDVSICLVSR